MADEISTTGKWVDASTGRVVDSEPTEGRLLVSAGGPITPSVAARIRQAEEQQPPAEAAVAPDADEDEAVAEPDAETTDAPGAKETATTPRKRAASR